MAVDSTDIGTKYNTQIPQLPSDADIQAAFKLYHYGQATEPTTVNSESIAGYLSALETNKVNIAPTVLPIGSVDNDLNNFSITGFYIQTSAAGAAAGSNYPSLNNLKYAGMLTITADNGVIYQDYQMTNGSTVNEKFWRAKFSGSWTTWTSASQVGHKHNDLYLLRADATGETGLIGQAQITGAATTITTNNLTLGRAVISGDSSGKIEVSAVTTTELGYVSGVTSGIQNQINTGATNLTNGLATKPTQAIGYKTGTTPVGGNATKKFVIAADNGSGAPSIAGYTASEGDLWFW